MAKTSINRTVLEIIQKNICISVIVERDQIFLPFADRVLATPPPAPSDLGQSIVKCNGVIRLYYNIDNI